MKTRPGNGWRDGAAAGGIADGEGVERLREIAPRLLKWYDENARELPWRSLPTPYRVWVSEIMLQQTRVEAALPYYERFVSELPDAASLASVEEARLLKLWEGLGYYGRVRNMQKAARAVVEKHSGELPGTVEELLALPGVGDYTAGAIASIAFGQPVEAVDGNVLRVLSRLTADTQDVTLPQVKQHFRSLVRSVLPQDRPGDFNQALMDLGATVCLPNGEPLCGVCPLSEICVGRRLGVAAGLPVKAQKKPRRIEERTVFVVLCGGRALLRRRSDKGLLAGMWELPGAQGWLGEKAALETLRGWGLMACATRRIEDAVHVFSHVEWHMRGWLAEVEEPSVPEGCVWADERELGETYAIPSAFKAYLKYLP